MESTSLSGSARPEQAEVFMNAESPRLPFIPSSAVIPSCLNRHSIFYRVLVAPYKPAGTFSKGFSTVSKASTVTVQGDLQVEESADSTQPFIHPLGAWTWARAKLNLSAQTLSHASARQREDSESDSFRCRPILTISRRRNEISLRQWISLRSELMLYNDEQYLKPLQGDVVPRIVGVLSDEEITMLMEPPHPSFWIEASADMPNILKERCVLAFKKIHARGVLHGDPQLQHMLIGGDGRVTIVNFQSSRSTLPVETLGISIATEADYHKEIRKVKFLLDFRGACEVYEPKRLDRRYRGSSSQGMRDLHVETSHISPDEGTLKDGNKVPDEDTWQEHVPLRIVVPDQCEGDLTTAIKNFLASLEQDKDDHAIISPSNSGDHHISSDDRTSGGLLPSPFSSEAFLTQPTRQSPNYLVSFNREFGDATQAGLALSRTRVGERESHHSPQHPDAYLGLSSPRVHIWSSDGPEDEEVLPRKHRDPHSLTEKRIRRDNLARCFYSRLPHPELVKAGLIHADPAILARLRKGGRRAVAYGTLKRKFGTPPDHIELVSRRTRHQERNELRNLHVKVRVDGATAGPGGRPTPTDDPLWAEVLGEPTNLPEGPRILTTTELRRRRDLLPPTPSGPSQLKGILKRPRRQEEILSVGSSVDHELVNEFENLPLPPRRKIRTTNSLARATTMFREGSTSPIGSMPSSGHRFAPQSLAVSPSLRTLSFWMDTLVGWSFR